MYQIIKPGDIRERWRKGNLGDRFFSLYVKVNATCTVKPHMRCDIAILGETSEDKLLSS